MTIIYIHTNKLNPRESKCQKITKLGLTPDHVKTAHNPMIKGRPPLSWTFFSFGKNWTLLAVLPMQERVGGDYIKVSS